MRNLHVAVLAIHGADAYLLHDPLDYRTHVYLPGPFIVFPVIYIRNVTLGHKNILIYPFLVPILPADVSLEKLAHRGLLALVHRAVTVAETGTGSTHGLDKIIDNHLIFHDTKFSGKLKGVPLALPGIPGACESSGNALHLQWRRQHHTANLIHFF